MSQDLWQRARHVFLQAIEVERAARQPLLDSLCSGDSELQAAVAHLFAGHESGPIDEISQLDGALGVLQDQIRAMAPASDPLIGRTFGTFRIEARLGAGGMGLVYRAVDERLGRPVALKLLATHLTRDERALRRFHREARAISALNHPNICVLYEAGELDGRPYLVLELLEGETLAERLAAGPLEAAEALAITSAVCEGLEAAHDTGILHRDIKPANILVSPSGHVKILDFGVAKLLSPTSGIRRLETLTQSGSTPGTFAYMSPEQVLGKALDRRSDLFSLGAVLYEMLTGDRAFEGPTPGAQVSAVLRSEPSRLAGGELGALVRRLLAKQPDRRFASAAELRSAVEELRRRPHGQDGPPGERSAYFRTLAKPGEGGLAADPSSIAVLPFADMSIDKDQSYFCEGMAEEIIHALTGIEGLRVASRTSSFRFKDTDLDVRSIGEELQVGAILEGSVRKAGDHLRVTAQLIDVNDGFHIWSKRYDRELKDVFAIQDGIAQSIVEALEIELTGGEKLSLIAAATTNLEAYEYFLRGREFFYEGNRKGIELAVEMFLRATREDPAYALAYAGLADCYSYLCLYFDNTSANQEKAEEASRRAVELGGRFAEAHAARGLALSLDQRYAEAAREFETALECNPNLFEAYYFYARVSGERGDPKKAARLFQKAIEARPEDYQSYVFLADANRNLDRPKAYRDALLRASDATQRYVEAHPNDARALYLGALVRVRLGEIEEGFAWGERAVALDPDDPRLLYNLACLYCESLPSQPASGADLARETAVDYFERSIAAGYASHEWIERDSGLDPIRDHPRFRAALVTLD